MAFTLIDRVEGGAGRKTEQGWEFFRVATVTQIPANLIDPSAKIIWATQARPQNKDQFDRTFPQIGEPHPVQTTAFLREVIPEQVSTDTVICTLRYQEYVFTVPTVTISSNSRDQETNLGYPVLEALPGAYQVITAGGLQTIELEYTYDSQYPVSNYAGKTRPTSKLTTTLIPGTTITFTRDEFTDHATIIRNNNLYVGAVNGSVWNAVPSPDNKAFTWLCLDISGETIDNFTAYNGKRYYRVQYMFEFKDFAGERAFKRLVYIDPNTGEPPADVGKKTTDSDGTERDNTNASKLYLTHDFADFNALRVNQAFTVPVSDGRRRPRRR
jgi:hypothetical protein